MKKATLTLGGVTVGPYPVVTEQRPLSIIASDIRQHWPNVYFGAVPYLDALSQLDSIDSDYYADSARSVVLYFLSNATTWRGEHARRIKAELKALAGIK